MSVCTSAMLAAKTAVIAPTQATTPIETGARAKRGAERATM